MPSDVPTLSREGSSPPPGGRVWLVGAGPGDPGLITVEGLSRLRNAEVVVYDRLSSPALLREARPDAILIDAGKSPGETRLSQDQIGRLLVEHARHGRDVVRLKGGDPYVYGRGWEERTACHDAGVPCRVIPGVSSAIAGPAAAGIPVTARGVARSFAVATPQIGAGQSPSDLDYAALAKIDTLCLLMARSALRDVTNRLIAAGRDASTPAAVVSRATLPGQRTVVGTLADVAHRADVAQLRNPAVVVIGPTVAWALTDDETVSPLAGRRVLVTRPHTASEHLVRSLRVEGAIPIEVPLIRIDSIDPTWWPDDFGVYDWAVFTSLHGVRSFWRAVRSHHGDARVLGGRIAAVGPKTADELLRFGWAADFVPRDEHRATSLVRDLAPRVAGRRVLFPCGTLARDELASGLRAAGATVDELVVYDTVPLPLDRAAEIDVRHGVDAILLYSPSACAALAPLADTLTNRTVIGCVGPTTADAARAHGLNVTFVPDVYGDAGMLAALHAHYATPDAPAPVATTRPVEHVDDDE